MRDYYAEINTPVTRIEMGLPAARSLGWCITRLDWCWKWRKITEAQKDELADRIIKLLEQRR